MSGTTWTSGGGNNDWFNNGFFLKNWTNNVPVLSSTGTQSVVITGLTTTQPVINGTENAAPGTFFVDQQGFTGSNQLTEIQIDGQFITLTTGANLTVQGIAIGDYRGTGGVEPQNGTISNLTAANGTLAAYDTHMMISATGTDTLTDNDDSQNFGLISASGAGNELNITIFPGGHAQPTHTLYNYGLIEASNGGIVDVATATAANGTVSALANPGWIEALGGTFMTSAIVQDDANAPNAAGIPDGYIEIGSAGSAILLGGVAQNEEVLFLGGNHNTLQLANNNGFAGNIAGFAGGDTIALAGETGPVTLGYAGSLLTVGEYNSAGAITSTVTLNVGTGYSPANFVALEGSNGLAIVTGANEAGQNFTFTGADGNTNFSDPKNYAGGVAPGLNIAAGETVTIEAKASIDLGALTDNGSIIVTGSTLISPLAISGSGSILLDNGGTLDLTSTLATTQNSTINATTANITFGSGGTATDPNVLIQNSSTFGFPGTVVGFGLNDIITAGPAILGFTPGDSISVTTGTGPLANQLYVTDTTNGKAFGVNLNSTASAAQFVETFGTNGLNIETTATAAESHYTFNSSGTSSFYTPSNYSGDVAPGYSIVAGEIVTIVSGTASISSSAPVNNTGTILVTGASSGLLDSSALTGNGTVALAGGGTITLANTTGTTTNTISFGTATAGSPNVLNLDGTGTASFGGVIAGMGANDKIDLGGSFLPTPASASNVGLSFNSATDLLTISDTVGGTIYTDTLHFSGTVPGTFAATIVNGGIVITDVPCFAAGTRILTPDGDVPVQALGVGDEVLTLRDGGDAVHKIIWAGRRTIDLARHPRPEKVLPVRILAGALGTGLPEHDLVLSPDHCLYIDGHLIEAKTLVNGATVIQDDRQRHITYHHIELERHDIVLAEGVPVETYLDSKNRQMFDGAAAILHPDFTPHSRKNACAKLVFNGQIVRAARQRLLDRALALGFSVTDETDLMVKAGIERLRPEAGACPRTLTFDLAQRYTEIDLLSSAGVPAHLAADPDDRRRLGVAITAIRLLAETGPIDIALDDPAHRGFHDAEATHRWTNGTARITLPPYAGRAMLEIHLLGQAARWVTGGKSTAVSA